MSAADDNGTPFIEGYFFYGDGCVHCANVEPFIADLQSRHPDLAIRNFELYHNATNQNLFSGMMTAYGVKNAGVPTLVISNHVLIGETRIRREAEPLILQLKEAEAAVSPLITTTPPGGDGNCPSAAGSLTLPLVIGCALVDSINPCGLAVLVFLLITIAAVGTRKRILLVGGTYVFATFLFHLLVGIGLFSVFSLSGLSKLFSILGGLLALLFGAINLAELVRNRDTFSLSIPESRKKQLGDYARLASVPAAFVLGILAGVLGFTCTGGIYISILGLMGQDMTVGAGYTWLVLYNLVFVLPLIGVVFFVAYGLPPERAGQITIGYKRPLRAIISIILIALGGIILLGWFG